MGKRPAISRGELEVARAVWELEQATVGAVHEHLAQSRSIDYATVQTYLRRLEQKGYVRTRRIGRNKLYLPKVSRRRVVGQVIDELLRQLFDGRPLELMQYLIRESGLTPADLAELRQAIDRLAPKTAAGNRRREGGPAR
jgi:BlaI family transcriptional regulator, penicillinase repressor